VVHLRGEIEAPSSRNAGIEQAISYITTLDAQQKITPGQV
jgi:hypothetical protein